MYLHSDPGFSVGSEDSTQAFLLRNFDHLKPLKQLQVLNGMRKELQRVARSYEAAKRREALWILRTRYESYTLTKTLYCELMKRRKQGVLNRVMDPADIGMVPTRAL